MSNKKSVHPVQMIKDISVAFTEQFGVDRSRSLHITGASCAGNILIAFGKLLIGIMSFSFFTCVSAFYTFGTVFAKTCALAGLVRENGKKAQYRYYKLSGIVLTVASILYIIYSVRLFFYPATSSYHPYVAMAIATFTFTELGLNIKGVVSERHNHSPLIHAIKMINLASSLICLVLTQTAILSFASEEIEMHPQANGLIGVIMGFAATAIGIIMIYRINQIQNGKNYGFAFRKVKKLMRKEKVIVKLKPVLILEEAGKPYILYVRLQNASNETFERLKQLTTEQLNIILKTEELK